MIAFSAPKIDCYQYVPKTLIDNLQYRLDIRKLANKDHGFRKALREIWKEDHLFFLNTAGWLYEPRPRYDQYGRKLPKQIPFITWPHQDPVFLEIRRTLGKDDIGLEKSRGEGASWHAIWCSLQDWCCDEMVTIGYVSRNKEAVYNGKDPNSLFWKLDFGRRMLPPWLTGREDKNVGWERNIADNTFINNRLSNTIIGYAATGNVASGGRTDWFLMDELSKFPRPDDEAAMDSTLSVSDSRLIVGTPLGAIGAYYDVMHENSSMVKLRLHWSDNVSKNRGLYNLINGVPVAVDPVNNPLPRDYSPPTKKVLKLLADLRERGFDLEKGVRSAWYDKQCHRAKVTPQSAAQEFDIDYGGSRHNRFDSEFFKLLHRTVKAPLRRGKLSFNEELKPRFGYVNGGPLLLWIDLDHDLKPPKGNYVVGCDVASGFAGAYTSNSTIIVVNLDTQEQVAELASNSIQQIPFADLAIAVSKWFWNAKLGWEANYASGFSERVIEQNYANVWARPQLGKRTRHQSGRRDLGWWTDNKKTKPLMFDDIDAFVMEKKVQVYSADIRNECARYIVDEKRNIEFEGQSGNQSHGDRVIGFGVCIEMMKEHRIATGPPESKKRNPPPNSMEARERDWEREEESKADEWDHTTPFDLTGERSDFSGDTYKGEFGWN